MNSKVKTAPVDDPVKLAVYDESGKRVDEDSIVWIDRPSNNVSSSSISFTVRMEPETIKDLSDIQYVVETSPSHTPIIPTMHKDTVADSEFVDATIGGGLLCNGQRGHARGKQGTVQYNLETKNKHDDDDDILAEIVAGWSEYHGVVTLTPRVVFKIRDETTNDADAIGSQGEL